MNHPGSLLHWGVARVSKSALEGEIESLRKEVTRLRAEVAELQGELVQRAVEDAPAPPDQDLLRRAAAALERLEPEWAEALVPLPVLRRAVPAPREALDLALRELERQGQIALVPIRYRQLVCECCGVSDDERGLLYYARPRSR
jgi:hypothetical protein